MTGAAKRLQEVRAKLLEMVDRIRSDPGSLEGRGDVESFLDELEGLAQSLDQRAPAAAKAKAKRPLGGGEIIRRGPVTLVSRLAPASDLVTSMETQLREALRTAGTPGATDLQQLLDALLLEMKHLDSGMVCGQLMSADRIAETYARLNPLAIELLDRFMALDRRRARKWLLNLLEIRRPSKLDLSRFQAELDRD